VFYESFLPDLARHATYRRAGRGRRTKALAEDRSSVVGRRSSVRRDSRRDVAARRPARRRWRRCVRDSLLICSDHGNVEHQRPAHTCNPVRYWSSPGGA
jgi:hypothetical protein